MIGHALTALLLLAGAASVMEQHQHMPGMAMPMAKAPPVATRIPAAKPSAPRRQARHKPAATGAGAAPRTDPHAGHAMPGMAGAGADPSAVPALPGDPHAGHAMPGMAALPADPHAGHRMPAPDDPPAAPLPVGDAPPPPVPHDHYADRLYPAAVMDRARAQMMREGGAQRFHQIFLNIAEAQVRSGRDGYRWDGEGWYGGDLHRAVVKSEGEGSIGRRPDAAEVQALYSRAIGPYVDLQAGLRQDIRPGPRRTFATIGIEGLAPYWFEVEGALFLSTRGDLLARAEAWYDQRLTQRLVLQPRAELTLAAQDDSATRTGRGLASAELGLRLRYEIARTFAPYVGVSWEARTGRSARLARAAGDDPRTFGAVAGVRFWF